MLKKVWRFSWWSALLILLLVFSTMYYMVATQSGIRWTLKTLSALTPGLVISGIEGNWSDGLDIDKLLFKSDSLKITANKLLVQWYWPDILSGKVAVNKLNVTDIEIALPAKQASESSKKEINSKQTLLHEVEKLGLPVELQISDFQMQQGLLSMGEDSWRVSSLSVAVSYEQAQWSVQGLNADLVTLAQNNKSFSIRLINGQTTLMTESPYKAEGNIDLRFDAYQKEKPGNASLNIEAVWQGPLSSWSLGVDNKVEARGELGEITGRYKFNGLFDFSQLEPVMDLTLVTDDISKWQTNSSLLELTEAQFQIKGTVSKYHLEGSWNASLKEGGQEKEVKDSAAPIIGTLNAEGNEQGLNVNKLLLNSQQQDLVYEGQVNWLPVFNVEGQLVLTSLDLTPWLKQKLPDHPEEISTVLNGNLKIKAGSQKGGWLHLSSNEIEGQWLNNPLIIKGGFEWQSQTIKFDQLMLSVGSNRMTLEGEISQQWQLSSEIGFENLQQLWPGLDGQLYLKASAVGEKENPQLQFKGSTPTFTYNDWIVKTAKLEGELYPFKPGPVSAELFINKVMGPKFKTDQVEIALTGSEENHMLNLNAEARPIISAQWQGSWSRESKKWRGIWQNFNFEQSESQVFELAESTTTTLGMQPLSLEQAPLCFEANEQSLCLQGLLTQENVTASLDINNIDLSWLSTWISTWINDSIVDGKLSAHNTFLWQAGRMLKIEGDAELEDVKVLKLNGQMLDTPPEAKALDINYQLIDEQWQLAFKGRQDSRTVNTVSIKAQGVLPLAMPERMKVNLNQLALAPWQSLIPDLKELDGSLTADIVLENNQPDGFVVTGKSQLRNGLVVFGAEEIEQYRNVEFEIDFKGKNANWNLAFDGLNGQHWANESAWAFDWSSDLKTWNLDKNCFKSLSTNLLCAELKRSEEQGVHALVQLSGDSNTLLAGLLPEEISLQGGLLSEFSLNYDGKLLADFKMSANENHLILKQPDAPELKWPLNNFSMESSYQYDIVKLSANMDGEGLGNAYFNMSFPINKKTDEADNKQEVLDGQININNFRLSVLKPFFPLINDLDGSLTMKGTLSNAEGGYRYPVLNGQMTLSDGIIRSGAFPLSAENLKLSVDIVDNQASISGLLSSGKGSAVIGGTADTIFPDWHAHITVKGEGIPVIKSPEIDLLVGSDIYLDISPEAIKVGGEIIVEEGFVTVEKLSTGSVKVSDDVVFVDQLKADKKTSDELNFDLDLSIQLSELVKFKVPGIEGRLEGKVQLKQGKEPVVATGYLNVVEGRYFGIGPRLQIRKGRVDFRGALSEPYIFIEAIRIVDDVTVGLRIQGGADNPQMTFFSDPTMPDDKILIYLISGKPPGAESMDADQMANQALLSLSIYGGEGYAQSIAERFGVRDLEFSTLSDGDDTSINVGGYLSSKVYVEYGQSVLTQDSSFTVRYRLREGLFLEAVSGLESALDIIYTFEF